MKDVEALFTSVGGEFNEPPQVISQKLSGVKALLFDWDGIFNDGEKDDRGASTFSEGCSMGINMVRFSFYLASGYNPRTFIVTGAENPVSLYFTRREHLDGAFFRMSNKVEILPILRKRYQLMPTECLFVYDDILDLSLAKRVGLRFFVRNPGRPLLHDYIWKNQLCEYMTGNSGGTDALREVCELLMGLNRNFEEAMENRVAFTKTYKQYLSERNIIEPSFFQKEKGGGIVLFDPTE